MPTKKSMKAVFDCSADEPGELSFKEGDILVDVEESGEEGWYTGRIQHTSETGLFPYNYVVELLPAQKKEEPPLSKFPPLDAFEAAMSPSAGKAALKSTTTNNRTPAATATNISPPPITAAKPKLASTAPASSSISSNVGLGIRVYGSNNSNNSNSSSTFEKPQLKPIGSIKSMESPTSPTRSRSYSTSAVLNSSEKEPMHTEKTLRPSQMLNGKGTKSALELALSKGSPKSPPSSGVKSNAFSTSLGSSTGGIALPGMSKIKLNNTPHDAVEEDEDGFQMVKPSQLRSRQQQQQQVTPPIRPIVSQSSSFASTTTPSWKKTPESKVFTTVKTSSPSSLSSASSSPRPASGSKLDAAPSTSTPMPRLPSRPVSTASRRSRNSRNSSSSLKSSPSTSSKTTTPTVSNANLPPVKETSEKSNSAPPVLKPKPQLAATAQPNLPPRPKLRSTSNPPPPIQPKPAMSSIEILLSKNSKNESAVSTTPSKSTTPPPRNAATKPILSSTNKKPINLSSRPSLDSWQSLDNAKDDVNIKPSALLKNNRARSATNPVSSSTTPEWMSSLNKQPKPTSITKPAPAPYERPVSPIAHPVSRSPAPMAAAVIEPAAATTAKKNPPPPPPSRPPKSQNNSKQRYEVLFDTIHDDGYVDGETAHFVWLKSKLSNEDLARIWRECDPDHKGLLDRHAFIDGMSKIDELLSLKQQQQQQQAV